MTLPAVTTEKVPHCPEAETAVLAAVLNHPTTAASLLAVAGVDDFWVTRVRAAMQVVAELVDAGVPAEPITVATRLADDSGWSLPDLTGLIIDAPSDSGALDAARTVRRHSAERGAMAAAAELTDAAKHGRLFDVLPAIREQLGALRVGSATSGWDRHAKSGAEFVLEGPARYAPVWGSADHVIWPSGEPLLLVAPTGAGKTTIALQLTAGQIGIFDNVLGWPVKPASRVLYLALDRPLQIKRAMRRLFGPEHREILEEKLIVWEGPLPADLGKSPESLLAICEHVGADVVWIDSLKDAVVKLTDDEAGGNYNRAVQHAVSAGVEVGVLHHQRKAQNGAKPNTLEDVYGSTWITAGAGSVVLLWGAAGDPIVDLKHLKQPAAEIGPLKIEHNHLTGLSTIWRGVADPLLILRQRPDGLDATSLARSMFETDKPSDVQRKKAERALERLARDGLAVAGERHREATGTLTGRRYHLAETRHTEEPT